MISCLLLAAGSSKRFGSPKALAMVDGKTVIQHIQMTLVNSNVGEIVVVLGDHVESIKSHILNHKRVRVVYNKDYNLGQTSSFKAGLRAVSLESSGIMLLPVDVPFIKTATVNSLIEEFDKNNPAILIPTYQEKKGHPPIFNVYLKDELLCWQDTFGLNEFARKHQADSVAISAGDEGVLRSFNTPSEFEEIKVYFKFS